MFLNETDGRIQSENIDLQKYWTIARYAAFKGVSDDAVSKAIKRNKLPHCIEVRGRKYIDWQAAEADPNVNIGDRLRFGNQPLLFDLTESEMDPSISDNLTNDSIRQTPYFESRHDNTRNQTRYALNVERKPNSARTQIAHDARQRILEADAKLKELAVKRAEGLMLDREPAEEVILDFFAQFSEFLNQFPPQLAANVIGNNTPQAIEHIIRGECERLRQKLQAELEKKKLEIQQLAESPTKVFR